LHRRDQRLTGGASLEAAELLRCNNDDFVAAVHGDVLRSLAPDLAHKLAKARFGVLKNPKSGARLQYPWEIDDRAAAVSALRGAVFVVFDKSTPIPEFIAVEPVRIQVAQLQGAWDVSFQPNRGAPANAHFAALRDWSQNPDPGICSSCTMIQYDALRWQPDQLGLSLEIQYTACAVCE
jgi:hypothetical protein